MSKAHWFFCFAESLFYNPEFKCTLPTYQVPHERERCIRHVPPLTRSPRLYRYRVLVEGPAQHQLL